MTDRLDTTTKPAFGKKVSALAKAGPGDNFGKTVSQMAALKRKAPQGNAYGRLGTKPEKEEVKKPKMMMPEEEMTDMMEKKGEVKPHPAPSVMRVGRRIIK